MPTYAGRFNRLVIYEVGYWIGLDHQLGTATILGYAEMAPVSFTGVDMEKLSYAH
jgi:hypothetical protein